MSIQVPQKGDKRKLVEMAEQNARQSFTERHDQEKAREKMLQELQAQLRLKRYPQRIECFDISMIWSACGGFAGDFYRRRTRQGALSPLSNSYHRSVQRRDDFGMMLEVLKRRFTRGKRDEEMPELVVVDGGKGQLAMALAAMREVGVEGIDVVGLAKMRVQSAPRSAEIERSEERVFLPGQSNPVTLRRNSNALFLLQRVRDEAHRFAITHHKKLRSKQTLYSALDRIPGIGAARRRAVARVRQYEGVEQASLDELMQIPQHERKARPATLADVSSVPPPQ